MPPVPPSGYAPELYTEPRGRLGASAAGTFTLLPIPEWIIGGVYKVALGPLVGLPDSQ